VIGWIDAGSGASGDMLLGALLDAGVAEAVIADAVRSVAPEHIGLSSTRVRRSGLAALHASVEAPPSTVHRGLPDVLALIAAAGLRPAVASAAAAVFTRLGEVEAAVHGVAPAQVHFHEVGALDAIADIVGVCAGMAALNLDELHCSPVAVGSGTVRTSHGRLSVPPPAVAALLTGVQTYAGATQAELCTPTGAALLTHWVTHWGSQPAMSVHHIGSGAGARDFPEQPNVLRLFVGPAAQPGQPVVRHVEAPHDALVVETNVDDLDPRLWPAVLDRLLAAGASDAWLTAIVMKKGRPAHTLSVLVPPDRRPAVERVVFDETSAIGLRAMPVTKVALAREFATVEVAGYPISVKLARHEGAVVNVQPEFDDVAAAASVLGRSTKSVLADAVSAAAALWGRSRMPEDQRRHR
jgi:uncharacterized protein (TIGR00299 family) protein